MNPKRVVSGYIPWPCLSTDFSTIVLGFEPRPFLYRIDLISDKSRKGSLRVHSLAVFVHGSTIVSGFKPRPFLYIIDLISDES
jgi:hypothetical protein